MADMTAALSQAVMRHREAAGHVAAGYALLGAARQRSGSSADLDLLDQQLRQLTARLVEQRGRLTELAKGLGAPPPWLDGVSPSGVDDARVVVAQAMACTDQADTDIAAIQRQIAPPLLPELSPMGRAVVVYGGWSLIGWFLQCGLMVATNGTDVLATAISLCGLPVLAFMLALLTMHLGGQPRHGSRSGYGVKLGAVICLVGMPLAWVVLIIGLAVARG